MINLYSHQKKIIEFNPKKWLICHSTGTGKTRTVIELVNKNNVSFLIICPKTLKENWKREIEKWLITNNTKINNFSIISKEEFRKDFNKLPRYDAIIIDECHYVANMKSQISKNLSKYLKVHDIQYRWLLTATPYLSSPWNIYTLAKHLGYNWNYIGFKQKFFYEFKMGNRYITKPKANIEEDIAKLVNKIGNTVKLEDCVDVPEQTFITEYFELTKEQKKAIIENIEPNPIVKYTRNHQIENGTLKSDGYFKDQIFPNYKNDRIVELCQENKKIAIFCRYTLQIDLLKSILSDFFKDRSIFTITGETKNRQEIFDQINAGEDCIVILQSEICEGFELPTIRTIIYASLSWSLKSYIQSQGRFLRINKLN